MQVKQSILRPNTHNTILAVIVFLVLASLPLIPILRIYRCPGCIWLEFHPLWWVVTNASPFEYIPATYVAILLVLILPYFIACLILRKFT